MSKRLILFISFICLFFVAGSVLAQGTGITNPLPGITSFSALFNHILSTIKDVALIAALGTVMIIIAGIFFLISAGSTALVTKAKAILTFAVIGMCIVLGSGAIIDIITKVGAGSPDPLTVVNKITMEIGNLIAALGTIAVIISAALFLTSAGSPEKMKVARTALMFAVAGIVIGLAAPLIVSMIISWFP